MTQHDLVIKENRMANLSAGEPFIYYWCICGRFSGSSDHLSHPPIWEAFIGHLQDPISDPVSSLA